MNLPPGTRQEVCLLSTPLSGVLRRAPLSSGRGRNVPLQITIIRHVRANATLFVACVLKVCVLFRGHDTYHVKR